jgi:hypothetical protein
MIFFIFSPDLTDEFSYVSAGKVPAVPLEPFIFCHESHPFQQSIDDITIASLVQRLEN